MDFLIISFMSLALASSFSPGSSLAVKNIVCTNNASIPSVRIIGCDQEPCIIRKGDAIPVEVDFNFRYPKTANEVAFQIFAPYWKVPGVGAAHGADLAWDRSCNNFAIEDCPNLVAGRVYTLKTKMYADPRIESVMSLKKTGVVTTRWWLSPQNLFETSECIFKVRMRIIM